MEIYSEKEIFNYLFDFKRYTPLSLFQNIPILEQLISTMRILEKEVNHIFLIHAINVNRGTNPKKSSAKDILVPLYFINSYSNIQSHFGYGHKKYYFLFDENTYYYQRVENIENIANNLEFYNIKSESYLYVEKSINTFKINKEYYRWYSIIEDNKNIKNYLLEKKGFKDIEKDIDKVIKNIREQNRLYK